MDPFRLATGLIGMTTAVIVIGYSLAWMLKRVAQFIAGALALGAGVLLFLVSAPPVIDELQKNKELTRGLKTARKQLKNQDVSKLMKTAQRRGERLSRRTSKLWR